MSAQILQFLQDVFNDKRLMKILDNKAEEFTLNVFTVNDGAREVYLHEAKLHTNEANHIIGFLSQYSCLDKITYGISGKYKELTFYVYNKDSKDYKNFVRKSKVPYNETYIVSVRIEFNKRETYIRNYFGSKDIDVDLSDVKQKMISFTRKYGLKPPLVILSKI